MSMMKERRMLYSCFVKVEDVSMDTVRSRSCANISERKCINIDRLESSIVELVPPWSSIAQVGEGRERLVLKCGAKNAELRENLRMLLFLETKFASFKVRKIHWACTKVWQTEEKAIVSRLKGESLRSRR